MDAETLTQLVNSMGFPIVMCGVMTYLHEKSMKDYQNANEKAMAEIRQAIYDCNMAVQVCAGAVQQCTDLLKIVLQDKEGDENA